MSALRPSLAVLPLLALLGLPAAADTIHRTKGKPIEDCTIVEETLTSVIYKVDGNRTDQAVPSETVLDIQYSKLPNAIEEAEGLNSDGNPAEAVAVLEAYLQNVAGGEREKRKWAPAYAAQRVMELQLVLGRQADAIAAADRVISQFATSRYVPTAYLTKAGAQVQLGQAGQAKRTLEAFQSIVQGQGLSARWSLEVRLGLALTDDTMAGAKRREELGKIQTDAGSEHPTVVNRARLAIGESLLVDHKFPEASKLFQSIISEGAADDETLAGAYTGYGDCLYEKGVKETDNTALAAAAKAYMRVVVVYKDHARYVPKAMFFAARSFQLLKGEGDADRARKLYLRVRQRYPASQFASEAEAFLKLR